MSQPPEKYTIRYQLMAVARDVLTISAVVSVLGGIFWTLTRPYLAPFLDLPQKVAEINARLAPIAQPHLVEFKGIGLVINQNKMVTGETLRILYNLKRNADCTTDVEQIFVNVDTGAKTLTSTIRATQAPVSNDFSSFILELPIPSNLPDGRYSYFPRLIPINCGIYQAYTGTMTEIFEISNG